MNASGRSRLDDKSMNTMSSAMLNEYDLAGLEEMDPSLSTKFSFPS